MQIISAMSTNQTQEDFQTLALMVGTLVIQWGSAEQTLEILVEQLFLSSNKPKQRKLPRNLTGKLEFLERCADFMPPLNQHKQTIGQLKIDFERLSEVRNDIIHGAAVSLDQSNGQFHFVKLNPKETEHTIKYLTLDIGTYPTHLDAFIKLGQDAILLARIVFALYAPGSDRKFDPV